jgi:peptidyl-prolyl cis-trans isomerase C
MTSFYSAVYVAIVTVCIGISCSRKPASPVIARVGKSVLTVDDFNNSIPPEYSDQLTLEQNINYVRQWIDTELLFQEAMRKKIDREPQIRDRLNKMKKDLLAAEMMSRNSVMEKSATIDEKAIHDYYELNKEKFIRERDVAKYLEIVVTDSRTAWYISKNATTDNFLTLAAEYSQQPYPESVNVPYSALDDVQPEVRQAITATPVDATSAPVKSDLGYHIIRVIDKLEKGGICKEDEIWEDIVNQLTAKSQKENVEQLIADLRLKTNVEFNSDLIKPGNHSDNREKKQ